MKREDLNVAYNLNNEINDCEEVLLQLSKNEQVSIEIFSELDNQIHTVHIEDDPEILNLVTKYLKTRKEKLEKSLENLL